MHSTKIKNSNNLFKSKKTLKLLLCFNIFLLLTAIIFSIIFGINIKNHGLNSTILNNDIQLYAVSGSDQTQSPDSGLNNIDFNLDLFLFVTTIIIISILVICTIVVCIIIFIQYRKRNKKIIVEYDNIKDTSIVNEASYDQSNLSSGLIKETENV